MKEVVIFRNKHFRVVLDIYTPRPHFILLHNEKNKKKKLRSLYDFPNSLWQYWIGTLDLTFKRFGPCIFSLHLGYYQSKDSPYFHAHYYVSPEKYYNLYTKHYQDKEYLKNLVNFEKRLKIEGKKYKTYDLRQIAKLQSVENRDLPTLTRNYSFRFHPSQPRVAFVHNPDGPNHRSLADLVMAMMEFIRHYELYNRKKGGCHLCIQNGMYVESGYRDITGYLQIDVMSYYQMVPHQQKWLEMFRQSEYTVYT